MKPGSVPLLAGGVVAADQGGVCASHNEVVAKLPEVLPQAKFVSSDGCACGFDHLHFNVAGSRELGRRYAAQMLECLENKYKVKK